MKNSRNSYEFFLSELFTGDEPEIGYIIELMRAAGHIKEIQKILLFISTPDSLDEADIPHVSVNPRSFLLIAFLGI